MHFGGAEGVIKVDINMKGLEKGMAAGLLFTKRTPVQVVNTAAYWVALNTRDAIPFVTPEKIDTELSVIQNPVIGKRGKPLKRKKVYTPKATGEAPLAALIVAARANPSSYYNRVTNARYLLTKNPFKGVSRAAGRAAMALLIDKMVKARHKSGRFLKSSFVPIVRALFPFAAQKYVPGGGSVTGDRGSYYGTGTGVASPAREGNRIVATISSLLGMEGRNAPSHNRALWTFAAPVLQDMVDREGRKQMEYALKKGGVEFKEALERHWK